MNLTTEQAAVDTLTLGPVRHGALGTTLEMRVAAIADAVKDVVRRPVSDWLLDFRREANPEREILLWELIAVGYTAFRSEHSALGLEGRQEALGMLIAYVSGEARDEIMTLRRERLSLTECACVLNHFDAAARARGVVLGR